MAGLSRKSGHRPSPVMNVTPLVDVVLVLLIIFMVVVPAMHQGVNLDLPSVFNVDDEPKSETDPFTLAVGEDGQLHFQQEPVSPDELGTRLRGTNRKQPDRRLLLRADEKTKYAKIRELFDICQKVGFPGISLRVNERDQARHARVK